MKLKCVLLLLFLISTVNICIAQEAEVLKSLRIHTLEEYGPQIFDRNVKSTSEGYYYVLLSSNNDVHIEDEIYVNEAMPLAYQSSNDEQGHLLLLKINQELEVEQVVRIKNTSYSNARLAVSDEHIVLGVEHRKHMLIGDSIFQIADGLEEFTLLQFDSDLQNMREIEIENNNYLSGELELTDAYLYVEGTFLSEHQRFKYGTSCLDNYYYIDATTLDTVYGLRTPYIIQYDLEAEEVTRAWKLGGLGYDYVYGIDKDSKGNIIVSGIAETIKWVTLDGVDSIQVKSLITGFFAKYNEEGALIFGNVLTEWTNVRPGNGYFEGGDSYFSFSFNGEYLTIDGVDIINQKTDGSAGDRTYFVGKFNESGGLEWINSLNPRARQMRGINLIGTEGGVMFSGEIDDDVRLEIGGVLYTDEKKVNLLYTLDKENGNIISYAVTPAKHNDIEVNGLLIDAQNRIDLLYKTVWEHTLWGNEFDTWYLGGSFDTRSIDTYFLKLDLSFLTNSQDLKNEKGLLTIFPNPVFGKGEINVYLAEGTNGIWKLFSTSGVQIKSGEIDDDEILRIDVSNFHNGPYLLHFTDGNRMQNEIIIVK
ncbi:MAG: T9SS type A sorting domain-containing protein [Saprospiraceae bacterium]|nr:T9SS type A sorting domain-containing protein [Saprospiraceae bacterium]